MSALFGQIVRLTCRKPVALDVLTKRLGISRTELKTEIREARREGAVIEIVDGFVGTRVRVGACDVVHIGKRARGRHLVGHVTDLHAGSKYFDHDALLETLHRLWDRGVRSIANTGDNLDGKKDVLTLEQRCVGWDDQSDELVEVVRKAPPFEWVAIDGNHDGYHSNAVGFVSGRLLAAKMQAAGVKWQFAGVCLGHAVIHGAHWQLWHPHGGASTRNALRRILNARAESFDHRVDVLAMGHFHKFVAIPVIPEGVFGVAGGTFQLKRSEFANRIGSSWDIGASIVSFDLDAKGRVSHAAAEFIAAA